MAIPQALFNRDINGYSYEAGRRKDAYHRAGKKFLAKVAADLGLGERDYDLRNNRGGIAVSGEVTLHAERIYIQIFSPSFNSDGRLKVMFRACRGRRDYTGLVNCYTDFERLRLVGEYESWIRQVKKIMETTNQ